MKRKELWVLVLVYLFIVAAGHWAGLLRDLGGKWMNQPIALGNSRGDSGGRTTSLPPQSDLEKSTTSLQASGNFLSRQSSGFHPAKFGLKAGVSNS